ncbi:hypothetical protein [Streptomyces sp. NBC_00454]|uniref:hypothetical protein n=1 Tax=Streptomyces sp. NBC_00454 TaxID=2975747 RepID=UPI0030E36B8B
MTTSRTQTSPERLTTTHDTGTAGFHVQYSRIPLDTFGRPDPELLSGTEIEKISRRMKSAKAAVEYTTQSAIALLAPAGVLQAPLG